MKTGDNKKEDVEHKKVDVERKKTKMIKPTVDIQNTIEDLEYDESSIQVFEIEYLSQQTPDQIKKFISPSYNCPICSESHQDFGAHMSLSHGLLRCGKDRSCHKFFENMDHRNYHEERAHGGGNSSTLWKIICGHCKDVKFPDTYTVVEHRYSEHSFFTCTLCSMITTKDEYYQIHMKSHGIRNTNILNLKDRKSLLENLLIYPIAIVNQESMTAVCYLCPTTSQDGFDIRSGGEKLWDHFKIGHKVKNPAEALLRLFNGKQFHFNTLLNDKQRIAQMDDDLNKQMEDDRNKQMEADLSKQMEDDRKKLAKLEADRQKMEKMEIEGKNRKELKVTNSKKVIPKLEPEVIIKIEPEVIIKTELVDTAEVEPVKMVQKEVKHGRKRKSSNDKSTIETSSINIKTEPVLTETENQDNSTLECKPGETYYCEICKDYYTDNGDHLCFKHGMVKCGSSRNCHLFFGSYNEKRKHVEEAHVDTFSCMPCNKKFSNVYSQLQHRNENHSQLTCMLCFVGFKCQEKDFSYFKIHMKTHNIPEALLSSLDEKKLFEKLLGELVVNYDIENMSVSCNLCTKPLTFSVQQNGKDLWAHFEKSHKIRNAYEMLHLFNGSGFGFSNKEVKTWSHSEVINKESTEIKSNKSAPSNESVPKKKRGRPRKVSNITESASDPKLDSEDALDELYGFSESPNKRTKKDDNDQVIIVSDDSEKDTAPEKKQSKVDMLLSKVEKILSNKDIPKRKRGRPSKASKLALEEQISNINKKEAFSDDSFAKQTADIDDILKNYEALDTEETHEETIPDSEGDYEKSDQEKEFSIEEVEKEQFPASNIEELSSDSDEDLASESEDSDSEQDLNQNAYKNIFLNSKADSVEQVSINKEFFKKKIFNYEGVEKAIDKAHDEKVNDKELDEEMNDMEADDDKQANELEADNSEEESDEYQINYQEQVDGEELDDEQNIDKKADDEQGNDEETDDEQENAEGTDDEQENTEGTDDEQENDEQENAEETDDEPEDNNEEAVDEQVNSKESIFEQMNDLEGDDSEEESDDE